MRARLVAGVVLVVMTAGCTSDATSDPEALPTAEPTQVVSDEPTATPTPTTEPPTPTGTCAAFSSGKVSRVGSGFVAELNIMSGMPNPAWRLSAAEGRRLGHVLRTSQRGIDEDGPDDLGGYGVTADRGAARVLLQRLGLPERFWVQGDNAITDLLGSTAPCDVGSP